MSYYGTPVVLARMLIDDWVKDNRTRIHHRAFMPDKPDTLLDKPSELSCYQIQNDISEFSTSDVMELVAKYKIREDNPPVGYGVVTETLIKENNLKIDYNDVPKRHVNVIDWDPIKDNQRLKAIALSRKARLVLW